MAGPAVAAVNKRFLYLIFPALPKFFFLFRKSLYFHPLSKFLFSPFIKRISLHSGQINIFIDCRYHHVEHIHDRYIFLISPGHFKYGCSVIISESRSQFIDELPVNDSTVQLFRGLPGHRPGFSDGRERQGYEHENRTCERYYIDSCAEQFL